MRSAGIVAIGSTDEAYVWTGGQYYLQHLIKCVSSLPATAQVALKDTWWMSGPVTDPFAEVRGMLGEPLVVAPPSTLGGRLARKLRRLRAGDAGARDLFDQAGIDVFFPNAPCENSGTPYVFWIPDFQHRRRPDLMTETVRDRFAREIASQVGGAARIVLSSFDAQNDFAGEFPQLLNRTHVVRFCSVPDESWWALEPEQVAGRYGLPQRFLIVCNQFTRHKNHLVLVEAMKLLAQQGLDDIHLACTGSTFDYREEDYVDQVRSKVDEYGLGQRVSILGLVPRADQIALLRRAVAVAQPSWFEGWSTLVEDAKTLGKSMFASDLPVHREQLGDEHAHYIDPDDPQAWAKAIAESWSALQPGPDAALEQAGLAAMTLAKQACGLAFVSALKAAAHGHG